LKLKWRLKPVAVLVEVPAWEVEVEVPAVGELRLKPVAVPVEVAAVGS
jgi:hypothetical protein